MAQSIRDFCIALGIVCDTHFLVSELANRLLEETYKHQRPQLCWILSGILIGSALPKEKTGCTFSISTTSNGSRVIDDSVATIALDALTPLISCDTPLVSVSNCV